VNQPRIVFKNTFALALAQTIEKGVSVFLGIFVARKLGARGLGVYSAAMVYYGLLFMAAEFGATIYLTREISKDRTQTSRYVVHLAVLSGMLAVTFATIARTIMPWLGYSQQLERCLYVIIWAIIPAVLKAIQEAVFIAYQRAEFLTYSAIIAAVVNITTTLILLERGFGVVSLVAAFTLVQFVVTMFYFVSINRRITRLHWEFSFRFSWKILREMKAFTGSSLIQGLLSRPEIVLLSFLQNDVQIGFFSAAVRLMDVWQLIPRVYMNNVYPVLSNYYHTGDPRAHRVRSKSIKYMLAWSFPVTVGMFVLARPILHLLYGSGFGASVPVLRVLVWTIPVSTLWNIIWRVLSARGDHGDVFRMQVISLVARLAGGYLLIRWLAAFGAAISSVSSGLLLLSLVIYQLRRDGTRLNFVRLTGRLALAAAVMAVVTFVLMGHVNFWVSLVVAAVSYSTMALLFKAFSREDFSTFRKIWRVQST
jgi:O-antigen/teichoic acid export membrane protein